MRALLAVLGLACSGCLWRFGEAQRFEASGADVDRMDDGTVDSRWQYSYGDDGSPELTEEDEAIDGDIDYRVVYERAEGRLLAVTTDEDADGPSPASVTRYLYDAAGTLTTTETDSTGDGVADLRARHFFDDDDRETLAEIDAGADGDIDEVWTYGYDEKGNLDLHERDTDLDGEPNYRLTQEWEAHWRVRTEIDEGADATVDLTIQYRYDAFGDIAEQIVDDGEPPVDERWTFTYGGP